MRSQSTQPSDHTYPGAQGCSRGDTCVKHMATAHHQGILPHVHCHAPSALPATQVQWPQLVPSSHFAFCLPCHVQESLSALFSIPLEIAVQLVGKHPALATTPPNATITKAKTMSLALGCTMQVITAKATVQVSYPQCGSCASASSACATHASSSSRKVVVLRF